MLMKTFLEFKGAKNIYVLQVLTWDFGRSLRFMTGVVHNDLDLDMVTGL